MAVRLTLATGFGLRSASLLPISLLLSTFLRACCFCVRRLWSRWSFSFRSRCWLSVRWQKESESFRKTLARIVIVFGEPSLPGFGRGNAIIPQSNQSVVELYRCDRVARMYALSVSLNVALGLTTTMATLVPLDGASVQRR
jgi:hypothetical protein